MAPATKHYSSAGGTTTTLAIAASGLAAAAAATAATILLLHQRRRRKRDLFSASYSRDLLLLSDDDDEQQEEQECIYLDYNGTTPVYPPVLEAMAPYLTRHFGNPSSGHVYGDRPARALETARRQILSELLGVANDTADAETETDELDTASSSIVFTACGTESDNLAIHWALQNYHRNNSKSKSNNKPPHVVTCNVEHPAIEVCLREHAHRGDAEVTHVPVGADGRVTARDMIAAIQSNTALVTLMLANNETGALQPVKQVAEHCRRKGVLFHTDAAQAAGKVSCRLADLGHPDLITVVGHKIGAPKGVACLYVRPGCLDFSSGENDEDNDDNGDDDSNHLTGLLVGGGQEQGRRAGTSNVPYIAGFGVAAALCGQHLVTNAAHMEVLRHRLLTRLRDGLDDTCVHGPTDPAHRLPNTLSIGFGGGIHSGTLLAAVRTRVAASAGATCHSADGPVSAILRAMRVPEIYARGTVRLSLGPKTTTEEVDRAAAVLIDEIKRQRQQQRQQQQKSAAADETANGTDSHVM